MAINLPVSNLGAASSFYLSTLGSLGYRYMSEHHDRGGKTTEVGLGPANTNHSEIFLFQSDKGTQHRRVPHAVLPTTSRIAVRAFYAAALNAGGRPLFPPGTTKDDPQVYTAIIQDPDGNKVEVSYAGPPEQESPVRDNDGRKAAARVGDSVNDRRGPDIHVMSKPRESPPETGRAEHHSKPRARPSSSVGSEKSSSSNKGSGGNGSNNPAGKNVVGTLLGAAAGAAVVYALAKETSDSKAKETKFNEKMEARDHLKEEARTHAFAKAWREKAARSRDERGDSRVERDSGYYSGGSQRRSQSPDMQRYKTITYPQPRRRSSFGDRYSQISSSRTTRALEEAPPRDQLPSRTMSQRSRPPTHVTVSQPPSEPRRLSPRRERPSTHSRHPPPEPNSSSKAPRARSPPRSSTSTRTVRYIPVSAPAPPKPDPSTRSYRTAREVPLPPSRDASTLGSYHPNENAVADDSDSFDGLDDETVVPDDSISVAPTDPPTHKVDRKTHRRKAKSSRGKSSLIAA